MENQEIGAEEPILVNEKTLSIRARISQRSLWIAWAIFATGVLYYCFAYLLRVYPSVMEQELMGYFHITAGGFGLLTSFYYFAYAPLQLPVGVSVDRIGPRRSLIFACLISILGVLMFAYFDNYLFAIVGRFMVGFGAAFAYVTALKLASVWLPRKYFATATGMVTGCGMVAAIFTDLFLTNTVEVDGFKTALYFPFWVGLSLFVVILFFLKDKPKDSQQLESTSETGEAFALSYQQLIKYLKLMVKNPQMWLIGLVGALLYLPSSVFLDVWAIPYLYHVQHLTPHQAALGVSIMLAGWIFSSFFSCAISDIVGSRKIPLVIASFSAVIISVLIFYVPNLSLVMLYSLLFFFGVCCGPHPLCFTLSKENNPHHISGTAVAFANFVIMMGGFVFQPVVGDILDWLWLGTTHNGIRVYDSQFYTIALSILPIGLLLSGILTLFIKETYRKPEP